MNIKNKIGKSAIIIICFFIPILASSQDYAAEILNYRKTKHKDFLANERSPLKLESELQYLAYFVPDIDYKVSCDYKSIEGAKPFDLPTYSGATRLYIEYGKATCQIKDKRIELTLYRNLTLNNPIYKNHLFLPIKDGTSGDSTYGGGRYMDLKVDDIDGNKISLDFNKLYNPWCAYSDGFNCPIPPKENHLSISIAAGEKNYTGPIKH